jgi:hypothetical protein
MGFSELSELSRNNLVSHCKSQSNTDNSFLTNEVAENVGSSYSRSKYRSLVSNGFHPNPKRERGTRHPSLTLRVGMVGTEPKISLATHTSVIPVVKSCKAPRTGLARGASNGTE